MSYEIHEEDFKRVSRAAMDEGRFHQFQLNRAAEAAILSAGRYLDAENKGIFIERDRSLVIAVLKRTLSMMDQ